MKRQLLSMGTKLILMTEDLEVIKSGDKQAEDGQSIKLISKQPELAKLPKQLGESVAVSSYEAVGDVTSFSPRSHCTTSTESGRSQLQSHLQAAFDASLSNLRNLDHHHETSYLDEKMLGPRTAFTWDEIQSQMSSSNSSQEDEQTGRWSKSQASNEKVGNKSVNFADRTEICQILGTPQVKPGSGQFVLAAGHTKITDGGGDLAEQSKVIECDKTVPFLPVTMEMSGLGSQSILSNTAIEYRKPRQDYNVSLLAELLPDLALEEEDHHHVMLNASKATSPLPPWASPTSSEWSFAGKELEVEQEHNMSILPIEMLGDIHWDQSCWELDSQKHDPEYLFTSVFQECENLEYEETSNTESHCNKKKPLLVPCDIALLPTRNLILVTEPSLNRIGIYNADDLQFRDWCNHPFIYGQKRSKFVHPTNILCSKEDFVFIIEKEQILILDTNLRPHQPPIKGEFTGLVQDNQGDVYTLYQDLKGRTYVKSLRLDTDPRKREIYGKQMFWWAEEFQLSVVETFSEWNSHSKCRFLTSRGTKLYITDVGLSKVYILDIKTNTQSAFGYMGDKECQLKGPTGILPDERGNLLICDSENDWLVVYNQTGKFIKVVESQPKYCNPYGLLRHCDTVVVVYQGRGSLGLADIVRYRTRQLEAEDRNGGDFIEMAKKDQKLCEK